MTWNQCVIDASMGCRDGAFTFCPVEGDIDGEHSIITGMNYVGKLPPDGQRLVAIIHPDGDEAAESFCEKFQRELGALAWAIRKRG